MALTGVSLLLPGFQRIEKVLAGISAGRLLPLEEGNSRSDFGGDSILAAAAGAGEIVGDVAVGLTVFINSNFPHFLFAKEEFGREV